MTGTLGLAMRARKLILGTEIVSNSIAKGEVKLVLVSSSASNNTKKLVANKSKHYDVPLIELDDLILNQAIGKVNIKVVGVIDSGFAKSLLSKGGML